MRKRRRRWAFAAWDSVGVGVVECGGELGEGEICEGGLGNAAMMVCSSRGYRSWNETFFFLRSVLPAIVPAELVLRIELRLGFRPCGWLGVSFSLGDVDIEEHEEDAEVWEKVESTEERMLAGVRREEEEELRRL